MAAAKETVDQRVLSAKVPGTRGDQSMLSISSVSDNSASRLYSALVVGAVIAGLHSAVAAPLGEVERDGPWAFTERFNESKQRLEQMAVTPAAEDSEIWLLLACTQSRFTASLMNNSQFPYDAGAKLTLVLRANGFPIVSVAADSTQKNQLSIDPAASRHLMPLFLGGEKLAVTINKTGGVPHDYTFTLQPNGRSLARIVRDCWTDE
jgi:hypothetical protein